MDHQLDLSTSSSRRKYSEVAAASSLFSAGRPILEPQALASVEATSFCPLTAPNKVSGSTTSSGTSLAQSLMRHGNATVSTVLPSASLVEPHAQQLSSIRALPNISSTFSCAQNGSSPLFPNMSQPTLIPATRFDTVTSYVDLIYQQQQQQKHAGLTKIAEGSDRQREGSAVGGAGSSSSAGNHRRGSEHLEDAENFGNVIYLNPSDGIDGDNSFMATCPCCAMMVMTNTDPFLGRNSYRMACCLAPVLLCWWPLSGTRFGRRWMDVRHTCPQCHGLIAIYRKA